MKIDIGYGQVDPTAKPDSEPLSPNRQPWDNLESLKVDGLIVPNVQTCEHNQAILDGTQRHLPNNPSDFPWGYWSTVYSDDNGNFQRPPVLDILFTTDHKAPGLTFLFYPYSDDWATKVKVTWYDKNLIVIKSNTYNIFGLEANIDEPVSGFRRIYIEFLSTNIRNRYIKLAEIQYGKGRSFPDEIIDTAYILEEVDPTSNEITINTLNFRIKTHNPEFSIVSGVGDEMLMRNQQMNVIANEKDFGTYFLKFPWRDIYGDGTVIAFQAVDAIGAMDLYNFWGDVYVNTPITTIINQIFNICFPTQNIKYELDPAFANFKVSGLIPICTCRQALQQICFGIGAVADDSRRDYVWIYPRDTEIDYTIPEDKIYRNPAIEYTPYYSGVDVMAYEYTKSNEVVEAYNGTLEKRQYTVRFTEPLHSLTATNATILQSTANYAVINVTGAGNVVISGKRYTVNNPIFTKRDDVVAGEVENIRVYDGCTLMSPTQAPIIAQSLFNYLSQRFEMKPDIRLNKNDSDDLSAIEYVEVGEMVQVPTRGNPINGTIEQLDINLRGGRAKSRIIGNVGD